MSNDLIDEIPGQGDKPDIPDFRPNRPPPNRPNYAAYRSLSQDSWRDLCDASENDFPVWLSDILKRVVLLPRSSFQSPLVLSYLMLPSVICNAVPILFSHGLSGSGKSAIGELCCSIHGTKPISAGSTFASIRNAIKSQRFYENSDEERLCSIVWEDVNSVELRKFEGAIFNLLKNGINRGGTITIAGDAGQNIEFPIFSPKLISSIHPMYSEYAFRELVRRVIVIQHKPLKHWVKSDYGSDGTIPDPGDLIDCSDIDWTGFHLEFEKFWHNPGNLAYFGEASKQLNRLRGHRIDKPLWKISKDLIATGVVCGYWSNVSEAVVYLQDYWNWHKENVESQSSALQKVLQRYIFEKSDHILKRNQMLIDHNQSQFVEEVELNPRELKTYVLAMMNDGQVEPGTGMREVNDAMRNLGWKLDVNKGGITVWLRIAS